MLRKLALAAWLLVVGTVMAAEVHVDCSQVIGRIRPLHGGNCGPIQSGELIDLSAYFKELGVPYTRLHDCHGPNPDVVDIHAVFPDFRADPGRAESYDFARTDDYIASIVKTGSKIVYRLGESIEHAKKKYYVHPPKDVEKWAAVCLGIIRHYNDGWANGFRHDIQYWEIWNEPENRPAMWTGSDEDYLRLYEVTAKAIKEKHPGLKVGGPSLGHSGKLVDGRFEPSEFMVKFLERCKLKSAPLDFFSWHLYTNDPRECVVRAKGVREVLDRLGFKQTEVHFNEWNYLPDREWGPMMLQGQGRPRERFYERMAGAEGAAFAACVLMELQDSPVDVANFYRSDTGGFGLFNEHGTPTKAYYAFRAFRMLLDTPRRVKATGACAGINEAKSEVGILIGGLKSGVETVRVNLGGLPWESAGYEVFVVDREKDLAKVGEGRVVGGVVNVELKGPAVCLVKLRKSQ